MKIFLGSPNLGHSVEEALARAPSWDAMFINRHECGYLFVSAMGVRYSFDTGESGWIPLPPPESSAIYELLGKWIAEIYYEA